MEAIVSAVLGDLIGRSISFAIDWYCHRRHEGTVQDSLQRLRRVLLRIQITVEEAERRRVTNQAMLQQLHLMREGMYRGYYLLNAVMRQDKSQVREVSRHKHSSLALSEFNPAKRVRIIPARTTTTTTMDTASYTGREAEAELQEALIDLERMASDMKELVLFLSCYPPLLREPYSRHLWLENRMFGREAEYERIIRFLLEPEPAGAQDLAVLPVIGPTRVGKSTFVEHVWRDERVRKHFSLIVFFGESEIVDGKLHLMPLGDSGVIKYRNDLASTTGSSLVVAELVGGVDESAWRTALSTLKSEGTTPVSKIVVTSRSEMVASFGTMKALELKPLSQEAFWYFFKTIVFGSTPDAEEQLGLASVCMQIADLLDRSFIGANMIGGLLRNNLCAGFWHTVLKRLKDQKSMHLHLFGEGPIDRLVKDQPIYLWRLFKSDDVLIAYSCYSVQQPDLPKITVLDVHTGSTAPRGKFEALAWRSYIPPYSSYVFRCGVQAPSSCLRLSPRNKQIRQRQARLTLM
ncbi:disease resistance protein RGA2-like [Miscanthus floridulus]|uniref:disease resistance protein RGA2-like n=1 Tax=Miscanthus floridulus TaxID=154761 RepID=UPI00345A4C73